MAVTRSKLVKRLATSGDITTDAAEQSLNAVLEAICHALQQGDRVELRGFGGFSVRLREARLARNPRTGEMVPVPEKHVLHFKAGLPLQRALNGDPETLAGLQARREQQCRRRDERSGQLRLF